MRSYLLSLSFVVLILAAVACGKDPGTPLQVASQPAGSHDQTGAAVSTGAGAAGTGSNSSGGASSNHGVSADHAGSSTGSSKGNHHRHRSGDGSASSSSGASAAAHSDDGSAGGAGFTGNGGNAPVPAPTAQPQPRVIIGMGTTSQRPEELFERGLDTAIFEARVCSVTGKFSSGSRCYAVYSDNSVEWVGPENRSDVLHFIDRLKAEKARREAARNGRG